MEAAIHRPAWKTLLAFAIIYFVWGSTFLAIRVGVREVPPFLLAAMRFLVAGVVPSRKAGREALTGVQAGWAIEPRNGAYFREPTLSSKAEGNRMGVARARRPSPCAVEDPRQAWKLHAREPGDPRGARQRAGRRTR